MIRTLLVGFGVMGRQYHLPTLRRLPDTEPVGVVRRRPGTDESGLPEFAQLTDAIAATRPDLAVISTPHACHYSQVKTCLAAGCHVLVEKPLAFSYERCVELVSLAEASGKLLCVGLQRRYEGFAATFRRFADEDKLGRIDLVHGLFSHRFRDVERVGWRAAPGQVGFGILDDSAIHLLDLLIYFSGDSFERISGSEVGVDQNGLPHSLAVSVRSTEGCILSACTSYLSPASSVQEELSVYGSRGALFARRFCREWNTDPPVLFYKSNDGKTLEEPDNAAAARGRTLPLEELVAVLTGQRTVDTLYSEASRVLETHRLADLVRARHAGPYVPWEIEGE